MADDLRDAELEGFHAERGRPLFRGAMLLTGGREAGEDLVQAARPGALRSGNGGLGAPRPGSHTSRSRRR